jgi:hypothetical protein
MPLITIATINLSGWQRDSDVQLRFYADQSFIASDGTLVNAGNPSEDQTVSDNWFVAAPCTVASGVVTVPQVQLYSTLDSDTPNAHWQGWFYTAEGERICPFAEFAKFMLPATPTPTTWAAIAAAQSAGTN